MNIGRTWRGSSAVGIVVVAVALAACHGATGPAGLPTTACDAAGLAAASPHPSANQDRQLDPMLRDCRSIHDLTAAASKYDGIFSGRDPVTVATARCREPDGPRTDLCVRLINGDYSEFAP
jgi:hypothetical protein